MQVVHGQRLLVSLTLTIASESPEKQDRPARYSSHNNKLISGGRDVDEVDATQEQPDSRTSTNLGGGQWSGGGASDK